jgi:hypothetical protein
MANPIGQLSNPFPSIRPNVDIVEGESMIREIDFVELR